MEFMDGSLKNYIDELKQNNLYGKLSFEEQEIIEKELKNSVETFSHNIEKELGSNLHGVQLKFNDNVELKIDSCLIPDSVYRGIIHCSRLLIIANYQMFYGMDYANIVVDGKNIDNIKFLLFNMSMMCMFYHEIAHIYRGHLNLYKQWKEQRSIEQHFLDIQTLEWDADSYAATQIAAWVEQINHEVLYLDKTDFSMKIAAGAIHGMMYWQRANTDYDEIHKKEHPPIFYREISMFNCIGELHSNMKRIMEYIKGYENEFNKLRGNKYFDSRRYFMGSKENASWIKNIEDNWKVVKSWLRKFSIMPLDDIDSLQIKKHCKN